MVRGARTGVPGPAAGRVGARDQLLKAKQEVPGWYSKVLLAAMLDLGVCRGHLRAEPRRRGDAAAESSA